jgi:hypothetical protein
VLPFCVAFVYPVMCNVFLYRIVINFFVNFSSNYLQFCVHGVHGVHAGVWCGGPVFVSMLSFSPLLSAVCKDVLLIVIVMVLYVYVIT